MNNPLDMVNVQKRLDLKQISLELGGRRLIDHLSIAVLPGRVATVMGPSGCGKSSLLSYICGSLPPVFTATGLIYLNQREISQLPQEKRRVGILFQDALLFPHLTVAENMAFGLRGKGMMGRERRARVLEALERAKLGGYGDHNPATLSGGQKARVALMRTLLSEPDALLLDEPFSALDVALRDEMRSFVFDHVCQQKLPTLMVTHDPEDADAVDGPVIQL